MGAILGAGSALSGNFANRERRKKLGKITLADTGNGVVEIVGAKSDGTLFAVDGNNKILEIPKSQILDIAEVGFKEFDAYTKKITDETLAAAVQSGKMVVQQNADPSAKQAIKQHLDQVSAPFSEERLQQLRAVENPMQYISEHPQEAPQLLEWFKANSTYTGMIEAVQDQINQKIKESDDAVDSRTHTDGNLYTITLKGDNAAQGYITQGDVTFNPDGSVNKTNSNDRVTVRYADGHSEMLSIDDLGRLVETNNAQELKAQNADAIWEEESRRAAAEIDGTTGPSQGDPITLKDGRRGIFYADTGDGNYLVQLEDGSVIPAPQTAVTLLNRQPSQQEQPFTPQPAQTTPQQTAEQTMTPSPAQEPQNGVDNRIGRSLNKEEADDLITEMENRAEPAPELELTPENWTAEFGEDSMVDTPIGKVKMGENQYQKLAQKGRNGKLGMIKPTLTNPDVIIEDKSQAKEGQQTERPSSYVFVKSFIDETGERRYYFTSVTISKEGNEVVISNQERKRNRIHTLFKEGKLIHVKKAALPTESATSAQGNQFTVPGGATLQDKNTNSSANFQTNITDNQPQNGVDDRIGRSLNKEEADNLIAEMENRAEPAPELELTPENWTAEFGEDGMVDTPIGKVKMGENQYQKLVRNKRENYFGMIKPTLESPDMVLEEADPKEGTERDTKLIFVKTFTKPDGSRVVHFENVTIQKDNLEVSISSHELQKSALQKKMQQDNLLHLKGLFSSEGRLAEPQIEGSDLVPTPSLSSTNEDTTPFAENQIPADQNNTDTSPEATQTPTEVTYPRDEKTGHILFDQIDDPTVVAAALRNEFGEQALEAAQTKLQDLQGELGKAASTKDTFERLYKQRDLQREIAKYQQVVSTLTPTEVEQITPQEMNRAEVQPENVQNETNRSEQQGQETTNADTQTTNADQSEVDENGRPFVKASDGSTVFGEITEDTGLTPAPIKLSEGVITNTTTNDGYGLAHIEARHGDQIRQAGFDSVEEFVESVAKNYDQIKEGRKRNDGSETYLLQLEDKHNNTLFVELSKDGSYWNINSAGIFNNKYARGNKVVYSRHTQTNQFAETGEGSPSTEQSGTQSDASTLPPTSANEDTTNIQENQESASKNTENQTNLPTNKANTPILPRKQTAPKYAKEIAQFGDEVSIEDVVLRDIALGQKFSWEDHGKSRGIASELGFTGKEAERRSRISMLRNDGITVDDYVHGLWQEYGERFRQDDAQIRDALLDVLQRVYSPKAAMEQLRNLHAQEEFSQEEQNILTPEEQEAFWNIPVSEYAFREPEATTPEEQQIIDQAKQNGTYMKAPNGKPTNLTAAQWVKVRTQAFKNWFGDWEKTARIEKLRKSKPVIVSFNGEYNLDRKAAKEWMKTNIRGEYANTDTGNKIAVSKVGINEVTAHGSQDKAHLKSLSAIPQMIENSIFIEEQPNTKGHDKYEAYQYYVCGLTIDGVDYTAKMVVGVKNDKKYYDHRLTQIEKGTLIDNLNGLTNSVAENQNANITGIKDKRLASLLQTNSSKNVDENGEPLVSEVNAFEKDYIHFRQDDRTLQAVNDQFNAELQQQIEGTLPQGHIYQLGHPSEALQAAGIPNLPIELAASRLSNKSMQANHPFELSEIENLPEAIQQPLAVFRSATHIGSYVVMTEIEHQGKNYVAAIQTHRKKGSLEINDIRSIYPKNNGQIANWIDEGLLEYAETQKMVEWLSKQRSNSAEVRKLFNHATNIVNSFENPTLTDGKKVATAEELSETLHTPIRIVRNVNDIHDDEKEALRKRRAYGWYDMETGEVVIVLPNCRDEAEVQATILHEVVGHKGLRELVGEEKYNDLLRRVWSSLDLATKAKKQKQYGHPLIAADEYLASLAEENVEPNVLKRILAQVRSWLREVLGMDIKLSDNDLRYLLWRSKHNLQNKQNIFERAETAAKDAELRYRLGINNQAQDQTENSGSTELDAVNRRFNEQLETLTEKNADSTVLQLGRPSDILRAAGIADKPLKLYGNKVIKKMKKHGFKLEELQNLPEAVANPIAVFNNYQKEGNRSILTELKTTNGNFLVSLDLGKGEDVDFNIISSVFGKGTENIQDWINQGYTTYINKEKALNYLHHPALYAGNLSSQELSLATNIIKNFENPTLPSEENIRFREQDTPSDLPTSQVSSSQEKLREELKHLRTLRKGLDSEVMQYRKRGAQNESSSTRQLKDIITRYNRSQRQIREYVNDILDAQAATTLGKREINTLLSALVRATDPQKAEEAVHRILDTVTTARLRAETARTEKLYNTKIQGETPQGVPEAKGVDDNTRVMIEYFRAHKEENINESEEALRTKEATEGLTPAEQMHMDAIYLIRLYQQATEVGNDYMAASAQMEQLEQQIDTLSKEVWHLQRAKATGGEARRKRTIEQKQQTMVQKGHLLEATRWQLQELKQNYLEQLQGFNDILQEVILNGRSAYLDWVHKQQDRQREILQGAFADAGPKAMASARQYGGWKPQGPLHKSVLAMRDFFTAPLLSLDYLIRKHTQSAPNGEGHLYNQFIRGEGGYMEASNRYFERTREITDALGEAAQRYMGISGKNMGQRWLRAQAQARRSPLTFSLQLNDGSRPQVISATQALYLRALEKQTDGQVKLRAMGISEEVMEQISQTLQQEAPEMVALADWVQEQLLPSLRESYNATHLRLFGTQMREVAHYFPISINKRETYRENDGTEHEQTLPTTTTGSIISRKPNTTAIDWNMDFFEVLDRHIQQMEHWNAYSEVVQNMNRLTSNTLFKKSLEYKNPGEARKFMDAARVAAEQYRIQVLDHESVIVKLSQAAASSKINFRVWTAIKQIASSPAFVAYSADPQFWVTLSKHVATLPATLLGRGDYSWAKANLPDFRRRVQGGTAGNDALERESFSVVRKLSKDPRSPLSYGMWANAHMDAVVCAMGAKAVYEYQLSRHKRRGLSESEAQRAARRDAELSYNLSQQSALGVNLSPMQRSRNFFSVIFSTFQNAQFLYGRQLGDALRELTRSTELETEALYQRYRTRGMESTQARRAALKDVSIAKRTSVVRILTYGWGLQLLWVAMSNAQPYIFGGDDDDKNLWVESAKNPAVWIGPLQGLFGGGNLTSIAEGYPFGGPMLFEDISRFWNNYGEAAQSQGIFSWETAGVTLDLLTEFSLSQNSETFMNLYNGVQAFIDGHSTAGLLQLINAPRSQIKKILMQRGEHESLMQYAERINNLQELFRAMDRSAQGARGTSYPLYEELEQAN